MTNRGVVLAACLAAAVALPGCGTDASQRPRAASTQDAVPDTRDVLDARMRFGLSTDVAFVTKVHADVTGDGRIGVPISEEEERELRRRDQVLNAVSGLTRRYAGSDPAWAGAWLSQEEGGVAHVTFTRALSRQEIEAIRGRLPSESPLEFHRVRHPLRALEVLSGQIRRDAGYWEARGIVLLVRGVSMKANTVALTINVDAPDTAETELNGRYRTATDGRLRITRGPGVVPLSG